VESVSDAAVSLHNDRRGRWPRILGLLYESGSREQGGSVAVATELRDYRIVRGALEQWVEEWRSRIAPIRRELGFTIDRAWKVEEDSRFVWLLSHPGDWEAFEAADRAYYDSPQRKGLDPNPARLIEDQVVSRLADVDLP
jgi:hypothetical protein